MHPARAYAHGCELLSSLIRASSMRMVVSVVTLVVTVDGSPCRCTRELATGLVQLVLVMNTFDQHLGLRDEERSQGVLHVLREAHPCHERLCVHKDLRR